MKTRGSWLNFGTTSCSDYEQTIQSNMVKGSVEGTNSREHVSALSRLRKNPIHVYPVAGEDKLLPGDSEVIAQPEKKRQARNGKRVKFATCL